MKKSIIVLTSISFMVMLMTSCSKFNAIFDGSDKDAIAPITLLTEGGDGSIMADTNFVLPILEKNGLSVGHVGEPQAVAMIINDASVLETFLEENQTLKDIDYANNSLVIGCFYTANSGGYYIADQRIKKHKEGTELYLEICCDSKGGHLQAPMKNTFASLYPKLPDGPVDVHCWNNY